MPIYLSGKQVGPDEISWFKNDRLADPSDRTIVLLVDARLFTVLPGLRHTKQGWNINMSVLPLSVAKEDWIPRTGQYSAEVKPGTFGYVITVQF